MSASSPIIFNSPEYASWHEAGHVEAALRSGAKVLAVHLYREETRSHGRTRVERTDVQADEISLGGFGVEYLLYRKGRLLKEDGSEPTEKAFIDFAFRNAADDDYAAFWGRRPEMAALLSERDRDWHFMNEAIRRAENEVDICLVERIAAALLAPDHLDVDAVQALA